VNALARNVVEELPALLTSLEADPAVKVVVFASGL
jgi:enoyl-CoA hydratase/carnithine racemase